MSWGVSKTVMVSFLEALAAVAQGQQVQVVGSMTLLIQRVEMELPCATVVVHAQVFE